jgi:hypothetical protein
MAIAAAYRGRCCALASVEGWRCVVHNSVVVARHRGVGSVVRAAVVDLASEHFVDQRGADLVFLPANSIGMIVEPNSVGRGGKRRMRRLESFAVTRR